MLNKVKNIILSKLIYVTVLVVSLIVLIVLELYGLDSTILIIIARLVLAIICMFLIFKLAFLNYSKVFVVFVSIITILLMFNDTFIFFISKFQNSSKLIEFYLLGGGQMILATILLFVIVWSLFISKKKQGN